MNLQKRIIDYFHSSIQVKQLAADQLNGLIEVAGKRIADCLYARSKILICGNGGSASDAQHFSSELVHRFKMDRRALPAIALTTDSSIITAIANDDHYDHIFSRQIAALGDVGDILFAISTSGCSKNILAAVHAAHDQHMCVIALTGREGGELAVLLSESDIEIRVPSNSTAHIQETHITIIHCLCDIIDHCLFSQGDFS